MQSHTPTIATHFPETDPLNDGFILEEPIEEHNPSPITTPIATSYCLA